MNERETADVIEIQQLAARYMSLSARKLHDHWRDVFTADAEYHAFGTAYGLDDFPMLVNSAPPGQYVGSVPVVDLDGDTATGIQHYVFVDQASHEMRLAWYDDEYVRTPEGWRIRRRATTFMRRNGTFDAGNAHDPARFAGGKPVE
jgi:hypothetical protein